MKKYFYVFFVIIIGVIGFLSLNFGSNVKAAETLRPIQKTGDVVPIVEITVDQLNAPENNCAGNKLSATDDATARRQCPAQEPFYRNIGKIGNAYYCCQPPALLVVQTPLGPVIPADQAARNDSLVASACGKKYDYPVKNQTITTTTYNKISKEDLNIAWPPSPMGTSLSENLTIPGLIKYAYDWLIGLGGLMVFITLIWAGIQYLTSAGNSTQMSEARKRIKTSSIGLALLFGSWLVLNTINPILINLDVTGKIPNKGPDPNLNVNKAGGSSCGSTPCQQVIFMATDGSKYPITVVEGTTATRNTVDVPEWSKDGIRQNSIRVKSIDFYPNTTKTNPPEVGSCSVILYQLRKPLLQNSEKPSSPVILVPMEDIGGDGFPMQAFEVSDLSKSTVFNLKF